MLKKIALKSSAMKKLSPLLMYRDKANGKLIIADGYRRLCAVYESILTNFEIDNNESHHYEHEAPDEHIADGPPALCSDLAPGSYPVGLRVWWLPSCTFGTVGQGAEPSASAAPWPCCGEKFAA